MTINQDQAWIHKQNASKERAKCSVICTAGLSYLVLHTDSYVTRCFHDLAKLGTAFDFASGTVSPHGPLACQVGKICDQSGDQMFASMWEDDQFFEATSTSWRESALPQHAKTDSIYTVVFVTDRCNFNCPYCCNFYPDDDTQMRPSKAQLSPEAWDAWIAFLRKYDKVQLNLNGGEPLVWPYLVDKISAIANEPGFEIAINTNLSVRRAVDGMPASPVYRRHRISSSIHPVAKQFNLDTYMENAKIMMDKGWWVRAHVVTWPANIDWWEEHSQRVRDAGIELWLKPVGGYEQDTEFWERVKRYNNDQWNTPAHLKSIGWVDKPPPRQWFEKDPNKSLKTL